ncbi:MAG: Hsp20/alpha crystallin family protein [Pseudomonadota bacterium]
MDKGKDMVKTDAKNIEKTRTLRSVMPAVDIYENDDEIILHADMPGVLKKDVSINVDNGTLSLSGARNLEVKGVSKWKEFVDVEYVRSFSVPQTIDVEKVEAELKNGVLTLHLPKAEAAKPRQIQINAA